MQDALLQCVTLLVISKLLCINCDKLKKASDDQDWEVIFTCYVYLCCLDLNLENLSQSVFSAFFITVIVLTKYSVIFTTLQDLFKVTYFCLIISFRILYPISQYYTFQLF